MIFVAIIPSHFNIICIRFSAAVFDGIGFWLRVFCKTHMPFKRFFKKQRGAVLEPSMNGVIFNRFGYREVKDSCTSSSFWRKCIAHMESLSYRPHDIIGSNHKW